MRRCAERRTAAREGVCPKRTCPLAFALQTLSLLHPKMCTRHTAFSPQCLCFCCLFLFFCPLFLFLPACVRPFPFVCITRRRASALIHLLARSLRFRSVRPRSVRPRSVRPRSVRSRSARSGFARSRSARSCSARSRSLRSRSLRSRLHLPISFTVATDDDCVEREKFSAPAARAANTPHNKLKFFRKCDTICCILASHTVL